MQVVLERAGKKYGSKWIFKNLDLSVDEGSLTGIVGKNGSGKSTLLLILSGYLSPSAGKLQWFINGSPVARDYLFRHTSIAAPYMELPEEFTFMELLRFHKRFKPFAGGLSEEDIIGLSALEDSLSKPVVQFSSGMKQRLRLLLAILSQSELLLLDEPCSNLDIAGIAWYQDLLQSHQSHRSIIIASNHKPEEYPGCTQFVSL